MHYLLTARIYFAGIVAQVYVYPSITLRLNREQWVGGKVPVQVLFRQRVGGAC